MTDIYDSEDYENIVAEAKTAAAQRWPEVNVLSTVARQEYISGYLDAAINLGVIKE